MAWTIPATPAVGYLMDSVFWNPQVRDNFVELRQGGFALANQAVGDIPYASSTTQYGVIAAVAVGQVLISRGVTTKPEWSANLVLAGNLAVGTPALKSWATGYRAIQVHNSGAIMAGVAASESLLLLDNAYYDGAWKYTLNGSASHLVISSGALGFHTAGAGSADGTVTWVSKFGITNGGVVSCSGFGTHAFSAGGTGWNAFRVRNTTDGTANGAYLAVTDNTGYDFGIYKYNASYTPAGVAYANGTALVAEGPGGLSIQASHASGAIRFYSAGMTLRGTFETTGAFTVGATLMGASAISGDIAAVRGSDAGLYFFGSDGAAYIYRTSGSTFVWSGVAAMRWAGYGAGTATFDASGNITAVSDGRLKNRIVSLPYGLKEVLALRPVQHGYNDLSGLEREHLYGGFIAQDVQAVMPIAVGVDSRGYLTLSDRPILGAVVNAIQQHDRDLAQSQARDESLDLHITALETELRTLREQRIH